MSAEAPARTTTVKITKKPAKPSEHPPVATMVKAFITALKEQKGSPLAAIKKYIETDYNGIDEKPVKTNNKPTEKKKTTEKKPKDNKPSKETKPAKAEVSKLRNRQ